MTAEVEAVYGPSEHDLDQGDVLKDVPFLLRMPDRSEHRPMLGLVISHGCDIEKYERQAAGRETGDPVLKTWPVTVAPLHPPAGLTGGQAGDALAGRMPRYFAIPSADGFEALVADLWHSQPISLQVAMTLERRASLCERYRRKLRVAVATLYVRVDFDELVTWTAAE